MRQKPIIMFFPLDIMSNYLRCLVLAKNLRDHFDIWFLHSDKYSSFVAQEGFRPFYCERSDAEIIKEQARHFDFSWLKQELLEPVFISQCAVINLFKKHIEDHISNFENPVPEENLIIVGDSEPTIRMAAERCETRLVAIMNAYLTRH